jgi:hypothetical protein
LLGKNNPRANILLRQKQDLLELIEDKYIKYRNIQLLKPKNLTDIPTGYIVVIPVRIIVILVLTRVARRLAEKKRITRIFYPSERRNKNLSLGGKQGFR